MNVTSAFIWLLIIPFLGAGITYLAGRLFARREGYHHYNPARWFGLLTLLAMGGAWYLSYRDWLAQTSGQDLVFTVGEVTMRLDGIALLISAIAIFLGILVVIFSMPYMAGEVNEEKFYALLAAMIGAITGMVCTSDLFNLWVWFEAMAITSYLLVSFYKDLPSALESGVKYLVQSAVGSTFILLGIALVYMQIGTLQLRYIPQGVQQGYPVLAAAGALFVIGFGVKSALVPMHTWLPDAHSQAPSGISIMLSGIVIEAGLIAMLRVITALAGSTYLWGPVLVGFGCINMLVGNLMALRQNEVKRLLAYSSIAQMGYMLVGFGFSIWFGHADSSFGAFFHLLNHAFMKGLAFMAAGALIYALYLTKGKHGTLVLDDLNGAAKRYPLVVFAFSIGLLALGGLPPLSGFMSKTSIFVAAAETGSWFGTGVVIFGSLNAILSLAYYAPMVNRMYRLKPSEAVLAGGKVSAMMVIPLVILVGLIVVIGFWPAAINWIVIPAAKAFTLPFSPYGF